MERDGLLPQRSSEQNTSTVCLPLPLLQHHQGRMQGAGEETESQRKATCIGNSPELEAYHQ